MKINAIEIKPGEQKKIEVNVAKLPSRSSIDITINVARSKQPGPTLLFLGGVHGDEINGIEIVRRILESKEYLPSAGTTICIPILNVFGFIHYSRYVPDGKDVNRSFPGNKNGSLASRVAYFLKKHILPLIDYGIDFHTGGADRTNYPQIRSMLSDPINQGLAQAFNAPFTLHARYRTNSLRQTASKLGKKIIIYEGGESSRLDEFAIQQGMVGALRVMKHLKMTTVNVPEAKQNSILINKSSWLRAAVSGLFLPAVNCGDSIEAKQKIGMITDPFGGYKKIVKAPHSGHIVGLNNNPVLHQGDAIVHIGW